jgi:hypothetical protein
LVRVYAKVLLPVGQLHFEHSDQPGTQGREGVLDAGQVVADGRFGNGLQIDPDSGKAGYVIQTQGKVAFELQEGFKLRVDVWVDQAKPAEVAVLTNSFRLELDGELVPHATVSMKGIHDRPGKVERIVASEPLRLQRWTTLELSYDRHRLRLSVDGAEVAGKDETTELHIERAGSFQLSGAGAPLHGRLDECSLLADEISDVQPLAEAIELTGQTPKVIYFEPTGEPDPRYHPGEISIFLRRGSIARELVLEPGGILRAR